MQARGGIPRFRRDTYTVTPVRVAFEALSLHVWIRAETSALRVSHSEEAMVANQYITVAAVDGPVSLPIEDSGLWVRSDSGSVVGQIGVMHRKG